MEKCDYLEGDRVVRTGNIDEEAAETIRDILETISLQPIKEKVQASNLIEIQQPEPNAIVTSPLTIKGKAKGLWYFEGSFSVELVDAHGNTLAEAPAQAQSNWMTEKFVPFTSTLEFETHDAEQGRLIFHRANPSGLEQNAMTYAIPVVFSEN